MEKTETKPQVASKPEVKLPSLEELLNAGAHFGHRTSRWNPKMEEFIYTERNGVHIIDLIKTLTNLKVALKKIQEESDKSSVLIVGTKGQASTMVENIALETGAFYVNRRWPGGLFTNFDTVKRSIIKLVKQEETLANGAQGLVKKEQLMLSREVNRLNAMYEGIKFMDRLPGLVIVIDSKLEKNAIHEAQIAGIPIVALLDTNCDPSDIQYPIPANDDSIKSIELFTRLFKEALTGGKRVESIRALRNTHVAKLSTLKREHEESVARAKAQQEEAAERMKMLRSGKVSAEEVADGAVVRVVKATPKSVEKAEVKAETPKTTVKKAVKSAAKPKAAKASTKSTAKKSTTAKKAAK
ncbi:MAG: hypothetical protein Fur003_2510 [Candidatus Dojkabacteria bacterium]